MSPKKWFACLAVIFFLLLAYASFDIGRRTTFPGSKSQLKERLRKNYATEDTLHKDTIEVKKAIKK
ncbi:MAG TPA: hypothetical protein VK666_03700 [Chryseolinea sp.]|nr:hypothetical protein [Chryseolinea sp.]